VKLANRDLCWCKENSLAKNLIIDSVIRLKNIDAQFEGITISHDMTKNERDECKKLVKEAKQKENQDTNLT